MRIEYFKSTIILFILFYNPNLYAQLVIEPELIGPIHSAIENSRAVSIKLLENEKIIYEKRKLLGKKMPQISIMGAYGYVRSSVDVDFPTVSLPSSGFDLFSGSHHSIFSTQVGVAGTSVKQVLFSGMQIPNGKHALEEKYAAQSLMVETVKENIAKDVIFTFDQLMLLQEAEKLINDSEKRLNKEHQKVVKGIENGLAIPYDRDKLKLALLELQQKKVEINGNRSLLLSKLTQITDIPQKQLQKLEYSLSTLELIKIPTSIDQRSDLKALEHLGKALDYNLKKETGGRLPVAFAFASVNYINAFDTDIRVKNLPILGSTTLQANHARLAPNYLVGIGFKWNVFDGGQQKSKINQSKLDYRIHHENTKEVSEKFNLLLEKNQIDYMTAQEKIKVAEQQVKVATNNLTLSSKRFDEGLIDMSELLAVENEHYAVRLRFYSEVLNQRKAVVELCHASGLLLNEILEK